MRSGIKSSAETIIQKTVDFKEYYSWYQVNGGAVVDYGVNIVTKRENSCGAQLKHKPANTLHADFSKNF